MEFSPQQIQAMDLIGKWFTHDSSRPFVLNGFAGTGKTTIAKNISDAIGISKSEVIYVAYTGKATLQLKRKGCDDATTVHKLLYQPVEKSKEELYRLENLLTERMKEKAGKIELHDLRVMIKNEKKNLQKASFEKVLDEERIGRSKIIIVDESSMINNAIADDLAATGLPVIYCGDPFQLPPFEGCSPISSIEPDIMLTEVHRQALDNPILALATRLRNGEWFGYQELTERNGDQQLSVVGRSKCNYDLYDQHDQIICALNRSKWILNKKIQDRKIIEGKVTIKDNIEVGVGDRIMFLMNDIENDICNGSIGHIENIERVDPSDPNVSFPHKYWKICGKTEDALFEEYRVNHEPITTPPQVLKAQLRDMGERIRGQHIDLAYAITCHKAQGSEWDSVLVHYEKLHGTNMSRWLYTSLTRAAKKCTISVPDGELL